MVVGDTAPPHSAAGGAGHQHRRVLHHHPRRGVCHRLGAALPSRPLTAVVVQMGVSCRAPGADEGEDLQRDAQCGHLGVHLRLPGLPVRGRAAGVLERHSSGMHPWTRFLLHQLYSKIALRAVWFQKNCLKVGRICPRFYVVYKNAKKKTR